MGHSVRTTAGGRVFGAPDVPNGTPVNLCAERTLMCAAILRDGSVKADDAHGAWMTAPLTDSKKVQLLPELRVAAGVMSKAAVEAAGDPC